MGRMKKYTEGSKNSGTRTLRMHIGLYVSIFVMTMILGITVVLFVTNNIFPGRNNVSTVIMREANTIGADVEDHLNSMTAEAINFSKILSADIEYRLYEEGISFADLQTNPEILLDILDRETDLLMLALERADCSGVYLALNTTINPKLATAGHSRAGIYFRRVEPKRIGNASEMLYLRGSSSFAQRRNMTLQANWDLEFDVAGQAFWERPLQAREAAPDKKLSDSYVWLFDKIIPQNKENTLLCSIPLLGEKGEFLGVCGFEITAASFRYRHAFDGEGYPELGLMVSAIDDENINAGASGALFSGDKMVEYTLIGEKVLRIAEVRGNLVKLQTDRNTYFGQCQEIPLYHNSAYYSGQRYALTVLLPEPDFNRILRADVIRATIIFSFVLGLGIFVSLFLSHRIAKPFSTVLSMAGVNKSEKPDTELSVGIKELDELLQLFSEKNPGQTAQIGDMFEGFLDKLGLLTPAERTIVKRYMDGQSFETISRELCIAPSTLKTHNIHIYKKMEVKGVNEIKLYLDLINNSNSGGRLREVLGKPLE